MAKYEGGLGCPHCGWTGSSLAKRTQHIQEKHPGENAGPTDDIRDVMDRIGTPGVQGLVNHMKGMTTRLTGTTDSPEPEHMATITSLFRDRRS